MCATLHSNAILTPPVSAASREDQFEALTRTLRLDPTDSEDDILAHLRDDSKISTESLIRAVESLGPLSTFRGVAGTGKDGWNPEDQIEQQRSGELGRRLKVAGVRFVVLGDVRDEVSAPPGRMQRTKAKIDDRLRSTLQLTPANLATTSCHTLSRFTAPIWLESCWRRMGRLWIPSRAQRPTEFKAE